MKCIELVDERVHDYYWNDDLNCTITSLLTLSEIFHIKLREQVVDAGIGMPGAGRYGAQCGLVCSSLMFIGILGREKGLQPKDIVNTCHEFTKGFEQEFGNLNCRDLRPQGFKPDNPPHLCEQITKKAIMFTVNYLKSIDYIKE